MKKKIFSVILALVILISLTGCFNSRDNKDLKLVYTSVYPTEYLLESLYGDNMAIHSIYPDETKYQNYKLSNKQLADYSNSELFVYNSFIEKEKDYAVTMINKNKKIKIIDASLGMNTYYNIEELWLNPSNYLMMASNIKTGLEEYVSQKIDISDKIDKNYEKLKLEISALDAELKEAATSSGNPVIVTSNTTFKFLEKYGFKVYTLDKDNLTNNDLENVRKLMSSGVIKYIFTIDNEEETDIIKNLKEEFGLEIVSLDSLSTLKAEDRMNNKDYISIMQNNISSIRLEIN